MEENITYFETPGKENTAEVLRLVMERASARGIGKVVLASTRGDTARAAADAFEGSGLRLVVVPHQFGFGERQRFPEGLVTELRERGHEVHFGTMLFHTDEFYGVRTPRAMANLLRIFGQGIKVCVEIILMASDAGKLELGEKVIAVAGTAAGADTAVVATAGATPVVSSLATTSPGPQQLRIHELICKPL